MLTVAHIFPRFLFTRTYFTWFRHSMPAGNTWSRRCRTSDDLGNDLKAAELADRADLEDDRRSDWRPVATTALVLLLLLRLRRRLTCMYRVLRLLLRAVSITKPGSRHTRFTSIATVGDSDSAMLRAQPLV
jgi:hypothetical protein